MDSSISTWRVSDSGGEGGKRVRSASTSDGVGVGVGLW